MLSQAQVTRNEIGEILAYDFNTLVVQGVGIGGSQSESSISLLAYVKQKKGEKIQNGAYSGTYGTIGQHREKNMTIARHRCTGIISYSVYIMCRYLQWARSAYII